MLSEGEIQRTKEKNVGNMLSQCGVPRLLLLINSELTPGAHWALFVLRHEGVIRFVMLLCISSESNCHTNTLSADIHFCLSLLHWLVQKKKCSQYKHLLVKGDT